MNKLQLGNVDPVGGSAEHIYPTEDVYDVWREFIFMVENFSGPFTATSSDDLLGDTATKFARLFPEWPPPPPHSKERNLVYAPWKRRQILRRLYKNIDR